MASKKIKGIVIEIGGDTSKLGDALKDVEKKTSSLQSELREVERALKFNPDNVELLAQKQKILTDTVEETTNKLELLRKAEEQVLEQFNKGDIGEDQLRAFQREIITTESKLDSLKNALDETENNIEDVGDQAEESSEGFTIMKGALADLVSNAIQGAVSSIGDFIGSLMDLSEATEEYRTMQAKLEGSASNFGYSVDFANEKYKEFYKYLGDDQASTNAITNLLGIGTSTESLSQLVEGATGAWATYGDSINVESLTEAINETITCGKVTGSFADTINWTKDSSENLKTALEGNNEATKAYNDALKEGLPVEDAFNEALAKITDEQERADVVAQFLNITYGESKDTYDELNKSVMDTNDAELELKETQAHLGETLAPVNNALTDLKNQALEAITPLVEQLATAFLNLLTWLKEHPGAISAITAVVAGLATAFTILAGALAIQGLISGVTKAVALLNATLLANPLVLIVTLITAVVVAIGVFLATNEDARKKIKEIWKSITGYFSEAWKSAVNTWNNAKTYFSNLWNAIKTIFSSVKPYFSSKFSEAWSAVNSVFSSWGSFFGGLWNTIKTKFSTIGTSIANAISSSVRSGVNGVISSIESTINSGIRLINGAIRLANKLPGVNVGTISTLSFPRLARGGIVDSPTLAQIGEDGAEAVIPLENNTEWIRLVARGLSDQLGMSGGNAELLNKLDNIYEKLGRLQVVLDTGTLVGETIDKIDAGLGDRQSLRARGV